MALVAIITSYPMMYLKFGLISIVSVIVFLYNPSFGLIFISISLALIAYGIIKKRSWYCLLYLAISVICYLSFESYTAKLQAEKIVNKIMAYYSDHNSTPEKLDDVFSSRTMFMTPTFSEYNYFKDYETDEYCVWRLYYTDIWGKSFFYDNKTGDIEYRVHLDASKQENWMIK